jgi:hypothetical protein
METLKARRVWSKVFQAMNENNLNPRILYSVKLSLKIDGAIKGIHNKQKLKQYMTTKPLLQKILQGILHTENKANKNTKGQAIPNHRRRKGKKGKSNIHSATHNQTLNQQRHLNDKDHLIPINTNTEH